MKRARIFYLLLTILCVAGIILYFMYFVVTDDHKSPEITIPEGQLELSVEDGREKLLEGVTAFDQRSGDVTPSIVVETIKNLKSDGSARATLAAFDRSGNVVKGVREIRYTDYRSPKFELTAPLLFKEDISYNLLDCVKASDVFDGDITNRVKVTVLEAEHSISRAGEYKVQFRVTNSLGDTSYLEAPVYVYPADSYNAKVELTQYIVYLKKGTRLIPDDYFVRLTAGTREYTRDTSGLTLDMKSNVRFMEPGVYTITYTASYGNYTGGSRLLVVVED